MANFNQKHLIEKIIIYCRRWDDEILAAKLAHDDGLCHGFSVVYCLMYALGKLLEWHNHLSLVSEWDGIRPLARQEQWVFEFVISQLLLGQTDKQYIDKNPLNWLQRQGWFEYTTFIRNFSNVISSRNQAKRIRSSKRIAGYFNTPLASLLISKFVQDGDICLINSIDPLHCCAMRCQTVGNQKKWFLYDPNHETFEEELSNRGKFLLAGKAHIRVKTTQFKSNQSLQPLSSNSLRVFVGLLCLSVQDPFSIISQCSIWPNIRVKPTYV